MAVYFKFRSFFRSLFPGVRVDHGQQIQLEEIPVESVENVNHGLQIEPAPGTGKNHERNKRKAARRKELARQKRLVEFKMKNGILSKDSNVACGPARMLVQARELYAMGFLPSSAVCARIALEQFLRRLCEVRGVRVVTARSRLADVIDALCFDGYFDHKQRSIICQHLAVANGAAHGDELLTWWEVASLLSFVATTITTLGLPTSN